MAAMDVIELRAWLGFDWLVQVVDVTLPLQGTRGMNWVNKK